ncbi:hypothetical protein Bp8pC_028 [Bacillus phage Bp8p-C]|uniref:Uncharacterized protein n=2 Tax=Agatevirus Bp8pC TaxID=1910937 RepID=A0A0A0PQG8_9CAUD|nr:hypothetical protein AXJ20_gp028 [Bacillus phage Bp8p-C]YP_009784329.1 hypothetical protein QLX39_gp028 [Bacillus phage Bp8p-T]AHJ87459.1 hypothetical protein Bp8pC_028 [Bacillus phage Bp8p-C]AHJ87670.1 hypothetical protein Bp8pT_028 [Bacillus phage Bp8p-T]
MSKKIEPFPPMSEWSDEALEKLGWSMSEDAKHSEEIMRVRELLEKHKRPKPRFYSYGTQTGRMPCSKPALLGEPIGGIREFPPVNLHIKHTSERLGVTAGKTYKAFVVSVERCELALMNDNGYLISNPLTGFFQAEISPFTRP